MSEVSCIRPRLYGTRCPPLTSSMRDVLPPFAMMISLQLTSAALPTPDCALHDTSARTGRSSEKKNIHFVSNLFYIFCRLAPSMQLGQFHRGVRDPGSLHPKRQ